MPKLPRNVLSNLLSAKDWDKTILCGALHTRTWLVEIYRWQRVAWLARANLWIQIYQVVSILMTSNRCIFSVAEAPENFSLSDEMHNSVLLCFVHKCIMFLRPRHKYLNYFPDQVDRICSKDDACSVDRCKLFYCTIVTDYGCDLDLCQFAYRLFIILPLL